MNPGDMIVLVAALSAHRRAAFEAADFMMDHLKSQAPFWKKEGDQWVGEDPADIAALDRWR
jgi:molybdopterin synthase catalytic subunit